MTEGQARALLRRGDRDGLEAWIAAQPWQPRSDGWKVEGDMRGWCYDLRVTPDGLWVTALPPNRAPATGWLVATMADKAKA
jgi:hypothetical protein